MRSGGFDMRGGSGEAVAVARDVASSSPSKNASALDVMRYQTITPDSLPLANGSGSGSGSSSSRKLPALAPRPSPDTLPLANGSGSGNGSGSSSSRKLPLLAPRPSPDAAAGESSRLASYLAATSLEQHKPARSLVIRSPARDPPTSFSFQPSNLDIGTGAPDIPVRLQWGHNKRSRRRRASSPLLPTPAPTPAPETPAQARRRDTSPLLPTPAPAPTPVPETPAQARRRASMKLQRRAAAASASASAAVPAEKLMPPPSARGAPNVRIVSPLPPRAAAVAAANALHGRTVAIQQQRSVEEARASAGAEQQQKQPAAAVVKAENQQQQQLPARPHRATEKEKGKAPALPESPRQQQKPQAQQQQPTELQKLVAAARPELPRIQTQLSRKEKEEDFLAMKGTKLPVRPKRRPKAVEKNVSMIYPGQWLSEVSRTRYMVREKKSRKRKGGGLKAMESDSD
ncbi:chromatin modification-related protein eaf-1-like [Lolium rigidum]|uniref:chromatin modification-related protein eaf-1-like n=1 Tax=Lolium rigidum TaxID=89674 RepID=UPI001F5C7BAC|nr:chromatin modification-related protein eaf-1-like [Lolium rigidum]